MKLIVRILAGILIFVGLLFVFHKPLVNGVMNHTIQQYELSSVTKKTLKENQKKTASYDFDAVEPINTRRIASSQLSGATKDLPVIASVAVPSVGIRLPLFKGLANEGLYYGAGTLSEDQVMGVGNYAIASHRSDQPDLLFTPLEEVKLGATIYLTDLDKVYTYEIIRKEKVAPSQVDVLDPLPGHTLVTLLTCGDLYATTRLVVQGELLSVVPIEEMEQAASEAFDLPIRTY
ncbi:sortase A [Enterococcus sp. AZ194]|uniref:class A sortase n=1 Tax=Enterococcus sp. AZ194 TaxID=2774629 RepID=UPI003F21F42B